jgi:hypothetical protein
MSGPIVLDPLLDDADADAMLELWQRFGTYGQYSNEGFDTAFAPELPQRIDAAANFVRTGGRFGRDSEPFELLAARTNYFRETYAYGDDVFAPGIETFHHHESLLEAARQLHGRPVVVPAIAYANLLVPGQELAVHTDVGEFRGANRKVVPQWLIVVMHHSGLFDEWRMPIATGISYFGHGEGGDLAYYPEGRDGPAATYPPRHNTAVVLDTDSTFHGVDRVVGDDAPLHRFTLGMVLHHEGDGRWTARDGDEVVAEYGSDDLRYSVSWKAYCFADDAEREAWETHADDLSLDRILGMLVDDLCERGVLASADHGLSDVKLGKLLINTYIRFPDPQPEPA